jgi:hypothetical protein
VNDAPVAVDRRCLHAGRRHAARAFRPRVLGNDSDIDSPTLTAVLVEGPQHGTLELNLDDGSFLYTPDANYFGSDSFTYR